MLRGLKQRAEGAAPRASAADQLLTDADIRLADATFIPRPLDVVYRALLAVELADLPLLRPLMVLRTLGGSERALIGPIFGALRNTGSVCVEEHPGRSLTVAGAGKFWTLEAFEPLPDRAAFLASNRPEWARLTWTVRVEEAPGGAWLLADMRVQSPREPAAARAFAWYWRTAGRLGATLSQRGVLAATRRRAERPTVEPASAGDRA